MALYLRVRDNRWQFSFGSKYMVIADVFADAGTLYTAGGTTILLAQDPQVKSSRAPWFTVFASITPALTAAYVWSDYAISPGVPPSTTIANVNAGKIRIYTNGTEVPAGTDLSTIITAPGMLQAMCIFQGME